MTKIVREGADGADRESSRTASPAVSHAQHSPLPWYLAADDSGEIYDASCACVTDADHSDEFSDAAFIVRACNSHDALFRAARDVVERHDVHAVACNFDQCGCVDCSPLRAAIAKAEGN